MSGTATDLEPKADAAPGGHGHAVRFMQIEPTTRCNFTCKFCCGRQMDQSNLDIEAATGSAAKRSPGSPVSSCSATHAAMTEYRCASAGAISFKRWAHTRPRMSKLCSRRGAKVLNPAP
jgi:hypothetical protein